MNMNSKEAKTEWQNRIVGYDAKPAKDFKLNEFNWRRHPQTQRDALSEVLRRIGWVTGVIENVTTGNLIDGHARVEEAIKENPDRPIPCTQVELSEDEEKQILLLLDPIGSMATADDDMIRELMEAVGIESDVLLEALSQYTDIDVDALSAEEPNLSDPNFNYQSQYGVIVTCEDESHQKRVFDELTESGYEVRVVVV